MEYNKTMPRGSNLARVRGSKEQLAARFGVTPLRPGEGGRMVWIRAPQDVLERFKGLKPEERGEVVRAGLEALKREGGAEDAKADQ